MTRVSTGGFVPWPVEFERRYVDAGYWGTRTIGSLPREWAVRRPADLALICGERRITYEELDRRIDAMAAGLRDRNIEPGDAVLLQLPNIAEFVEVFFALVRLGAIPVMLLPAHRSAEIEHVATTSGAVAYVVAERHEGSDNRMLAKRLQENVPSVCDVFVVGDPGPFVSLDDVPVPGAQPVPHAGRPERMALLLMSGGTTGRPKLIARTHRDYIYNAEATAAVCGLTDADVYLAALPIGHNLPLACPGVLGTLSVGGTVVLAPAASPDVAFRLMERERVTFSAVVPPLARLWVEMAPSSEYDLSSLDQLMIGGARCDAQLAASVGPALGARVVQSFGMAEGLLTHTRPEDPDDILFTTQGRPLCPDDEIRVLDPSGAPVAAGEVGELWTRGPYTIRGYYRTPRYNRTAFDADGFFRTGDLIRVLPGGHLVVEGRVKEVVNRGGENVSETELEEELLLHPDIADVAVFGLPDADLGEIVAAALVVAEFAERPPMLRDLREFLRERGLARFKYPDRLHIVDRLPLTGVGKIDKGVLRALLTGEEKLQTEDGS